MLFRRRHSRGFFLFVRDLLWPRRGWRRALAYWGHRIGRIQASPHSIALGLGFGVAISFTPFIGLHLVLAAFLTWVFKGNVIASAIGTSAGNPWTFPFIWSWVYQLGNWFLGGSTDASLVATLTIEKILLDPLATLEPFLWPMVVGGMPTALVAGVAVYWPSLQLIQGYKKRRLKRLGTTHCTDDNGIVTK